MKKHLFEFLFTFKEPPGLRCASLRLLSLYLWQADICGSLRFAMSVHRCCAAFLLVINHLYSSSTQASFVEESGGGAGGGGGWAGAVPVSVWVCLQHSDVLCAYPLCLPPLQSSDFEVHGEDYWSPFSPRTSVHFCY